MFRLANPDDATPVSIAVSKLPRPFSLAGLSILTLQSDGKTGGSATCSKALRQSTAAEFQTKSRRVSES